MTMAAATFDTHQFIKTLKASGMPESQAEAISAAVQKSNESADLATKADLREYKSTIRNDLETLETSLRGDIVKLETSLRRDLVKLENDFVKLEINLSHEISDVRKDISDVRKEIQFMGQRIVFRLGGLIVTVMGGMQFLMHWHFA